MLGGEPNGTERRAGVCYGTGGGRELVGDLYLPAERPSGPG